MKKIMLFNLSCRLFYLVLIAFIAGCAPAETESQEKVDYSTERDKLNAFYQTRTKDFPFVKFELNGKYYVSCPIESDTLFSIYYPFFQKFRYEGNGECWAGHIKQILDKNDQELLSHVQFDPEAGLFTAGFDSKENQLRFIKTLAPVFSNLDSLAGYVRNANRMQIND